MQSRSGTCRCDGISYRLNSEIKIVINCHCNSCRSHSGAAFSTYIRIPRSSFEIVKGNDLLTEYEVPRGKKHFCRICGTPIFNVLTNYPDAYMIYLGTLDDINDVTPRRNIWCESKLKWIDSLASIKSRPQGFGRG